MGLDDRVSLAAKRLNAAVDDAHPKPWSISGQGLWQWCGGEGAERQYRMGAQHPASPWSPFKLFGRDAQTYFLVVRDNLPWDAMSAGAVRLHQAAHMPCDSPSGMAGTGREDACCPALAPTPGPGHTHVQDVLIPASATHDFGMGLRGRIGHDVRNGYRIEEQGWEIFHAREPGRQVGCQQQGWAGQTTEGTGHKGKKANAPSLQSPTPAKKRSQETTSQAPVVASSLWAHALSDVPSGPCSLLFLLWARA